MVTHKAKNATNTFLDIQLIFPKFETVIKVVCRYRFVKTVRRSRTFDMLLGQKFG